MKRDVDQTTLAILYKAHSSGLYGFAYSIVKNKSKAEDVLQETFTKAIMHLDISRGEKANKAWLYITAKNTALDMLRKDKHTVAIDELFEPMADSPNQDEIIMLNSALKSLDDTERQIVMLHVAGGMKYREIADVLTIPQGTVGWIYSKARKKLKNIMDHYERNEIHDYAKIR